MSPEIHNPAFAGDLKLPAQTAGVTIDGACRSSRSISPDNTQQLLLAEHAVWCTGKLDEQVVLQPAKLNWATGEADLVSARIDLERADS